MVSKEVKCVFVKFPLSRNNYFLETAGLCFCVRAARRRYTISLSIDIELISTLILVRVAILKLGATPVRGRTHEPAHLAFMTIGNPR